MKAININDKEYPFTEWILSGSKTIETRETNSLKSVVGKRVGIIKTGCGKALLVGYVDIVDVVKYDSIDGFRHDYDKHMVEPESKYDIRSQKYGYILKNPVSCTPIEVAAKGIVIRNI